MMSRGALLFLLVGLALSALALASPVPDAEAQPRRRFFGGLGGFGGFGGYGGYGFGFPGYGFGYGGYPGYGYGFYG